MQIGILWPRKDQGGGSGCKLKTFELLSFTFQLEMWTLRKHSLKEEFKEF